MNEALLGFVGETFPRLAEMTESYAGTHGEQRANQMLALVSAMIAIGKLGEWVTPNRKGMAEVMAFAAGGIIIDMGQDAGLPRNDKRSSPPRRLRAHVLPEFEP